MEAVIWRSLRRKGIDGLRFRRQEPIGPYIVDFFCDEARLVVEIDGITHVDSKDDKLRDAYLRSRSIEVLRFWNNEVMQNLEGVLIVIRDSALARIPPRGTSPPPDPLPEGREGEK